jgi:hypothetical protein
MNIDGTFLPHQKGATSTTFTSAWYLRSGESRDKLGLMSFNIRLKILVRSTRIGRIIPVWSGKKNQQSDLKIIGGCSKGTIGDTRSGKRKNRTDAISVKPFKYRKDGSPRTTISFPRPLDTYNMNARHSPNYIHSRTTCAGASFTQS